MRKPILIGVIVIFVAIILSMGWLLTTQSGLKASLNIVQTFVPALNVKKLMANYSASCFYPMFVINQYREPPFGLRVWV